MLNAALRKGPTRANTLASNKTPPFRIGVARACRHARRLAFASAVLMTVSVGAAADDMQDCFDFGHIAEVNIQACTRVLDRGSLSDLEFAKVLNRRAFMRCLTGDFDGAADDTIDVLFHAPHGSFEREEAVDMMYLLVVEKCV